MLPQEDVLGINGSVVMVVAKQPVVVLDPVFDLLEEVRQVVRHIVPGELESDAGGGAVGEDVKARAFSAENASLRSKAAPSRGNQFPLDTRLRRDTPSALRGGHRD